MRTRDLLTGAVVAIILLVGIPFLVGFSRTQSGDPIASVTAADPETKWQVRGPISVTQAYPDFADLDYTTVNALASTKVLKWDVPNDAFHFMLTFETTANSDSQTVYLLVSASDKKSDDADDDFLFGGSLVLTGGRQGAGHSNVYCDTAVATDGVLTLAVFDSGNDRVCLISGDLKRFKRLRMVATVAAKTEIYANIRFF